MTDEQAAGPVPDGASFDADRWIVSRGGLTVTARVFSGRVVHTVRPPTPQGPDEEAALGRIAAAFAAEARRTSSQVLTWERPVAEAWNRAMQAAGFVEQRRKVFVERDLTTDLPPPGVFAWRTLAEVGETLFKARLVEASTGDPFEDVEPRDTDREWADLLDHASRTLGTALWRIAVLADDDVGVVLPTIWPDGKKEGTLSYVGLLPAARGKGLGARLHASGLHLLAGGGALRYIGSTDSRNQAMVRVFEKNDCPVTGTQLFFACEPEPR